MATAATTIDANELNEQEQELEEVEIEQEDEGQDGDDVASDDDGEQEQDAEDAKQDVAPEEEELTVSFDGEEPEQDDKEPAPQWVKELRKSNRELSKRNKELEERLDSLNKPADAVDYKKPSIEDCDYDEELYERRLTDYLKHKEKQEEKAREAQLAVQKEKEAWENKLANYADKKQAIKAKDFEDAEDVVKSTLKTPQLGILINGCENPALMVYALGKKSKLLTSLAEETDLVQFAFKIAKLEDKLKVVERKAPPPPESKIRSSGSATAAVDSVEERLRSEAMRTGDLSRLTQYQQDKRERLRKS
jgi:hypothetical protein